MTGLAGVAVAGFLIAAVLAASPRHGIAARIAAAVSAILLLPNVDSGGAWPCLALALGAAALASPLPCLLAAAGATLFALSPESPVSSVTPVVLALAAVLAGGGVSSTVRARAESEDGLAAPTAATGMVLVAFLLAANGAGLLRWRFALGDGPEALDLRGAGLLLGLALLAGLAGTLLMGARLLAPAVTGVEPLALRLLWPAATLAALAAGHVVQQGSRQRPAALAAGASTVALLVLLAGALTVVLVRRLGPAPAGAREGFERRAAAETAAAVALVWLAAAIAGVEGTTARGTYLSGATLTAVASGLLGLAALAPARFAGARRALLLAALTGAVLLPQTL